jgi:hypothetical protein
MTQRKQTIASWLTFWDVLGRFGMFWVRFGVWGRFGKVWNGRGAGLGWPWLGWLVSELMRSSKTIASLFLKRSSNLFKA